MDTTYFIRQLNTNWLSICQILESMDMEQARWRPAPEAWSALEVLNHLADEERDDFRARLRHLHTGSTEPWPTIDPAGWVFSRAYNARELGLSLDRFIGEREESLAWLGKATAAGINWDRCYTYPPLSGLRAGDLLAAWAAHDLLHLRQLVELKWAYSQAQARDYSAAYAGDW